MQPGDGSLRAGKQLFSTSDTLKGFIEAFERGAKNVPPQERRPVANTAADAASRKLKDPAKLLKYAYGAGKRFEANYIGRVKPKSFPLIEPLTAAENTAAPSQSSIGDALAACYRDDDLKVIRLLMEKLAPVTYDRENGVTREERRTKYRCSEAALEGRERRERNKVRKFVMHMVSDHVWLAPCGKCRRCGVLHLAAAGYRALRQRLEALDLEVSAIEGGRPSGNDRRHTVQDCRPSSRRSPRRRDKS